MGGCFFTHASGRLIGWVAFARNPFHPPEGWRADFCSVDCLHQVVHCRARRPGFQDATSGGIVIHKEEHSFVGEFGSEFPLGGSGVPDLARGGSGLRFHGIIPPLDRQFLKDRSSVQPQWDLAGLGFLQEDHHIVAPIL